jgi:hypothetical protein
MVDRLWRRGFATWLDLDFIRFILSEISPTLMKPKSDTIFRVNFVAKFDIEANKMMDSIGQTSYSLVFHSMFLIQYLPCLVGLLFIWHERSWLWSPFIFYLLRLSRVCRTCITCQTVYSLSESLRKYLLFSSVCINSIMTFWIHLHFLTPEKERKKKSINSSLTDSRSSSRLEK